MTAPADHQPARNALQTAAGWIGAWPRALRIAAVVLFSAAAALALGPLLTDSGLFNNVSGDTATTVSSVAAIIMYITGWWLLVGFSRRTFRPGVGLLLYVLVGAIALIAVLGAAAVGFASILQR